MLEGQVVTYAWGTPTCTNKLFPCLPTLDQNGPNYTCHLKESCMSHHTSYMSSTYLSTLPIYQRRSYVLFRCDHNVFLFMCDHHVFHFRCDHHVFHFMCDHQVFHFMCEHHVFLLMCDHHVSRLHPSQLRFSIYNPSSWNEPYTTMLSMLASVIFRLDKPQIDKASYFSLYLGKCMPALIPKSVKRTGIYNPS